MRGEDEDEDDEEEGGEEREQDGRRRRLERAVVCEVGSGRKEQRRVELSASKCELRLLAGRGLDALVCQPSILRCLLLLLLLLSADGLVGEAAAGSAR